MTIDYRYKLPELGSYELPMTTTIDKNLRGSQQGKQEEVCFVISKTLNNENSVFNSLLLLH